MRYRQLFEADDYDLLAKYQYFNRLAFDGKLPTIPVTWALLKNVGGDARVIHVLNPSKPRPNPVMVRLGREDRYSNYDIKPGSMNIRITTLYKRSERSIDQILLHEMIHILMFVTGRSGEGHGRLFQDETRRIERIVGFHIPLKDSVEGMEMTDTIKVKPYGVILLETKQGYRYAMLSPQVVEREVEAIRERHAYFVKHNYYQKVWVYIIADELWAQQAMKTTVQRQFGYKTGYRPLTDQSLMDDLHANGKLLATIP